MKGVVVEFNTYNGIRFMVLADSDTMFVRSVSWVSLVGVMEVSNIFKSNPHTLTPNNLDSVCELAYKQK